MNVLLPRHCSKYVKARTVQVCVNNHPSKLENFKIKHKYVEYDFGAGRLCTKITNSELTKK